jgi:hypothetical protein
MAVVASAAQAADAYSIDPVSSIPVFQVLHLGLVTQRGRFDRVSGKLTPTPRRFPPSHSNPTSSFSRATASWALAAS